MRLRWTNELIDFASARPDMRRADLAVLMSKKFGLDITHSRLANACNRYSIPSTPKGRFTSEAMKGNQIRKGAPGNRTTFKPGNKPKQTRPLWSEKLNKDGKWMIKIGMDGKRSENWISKARHTWQKANGEVPKGHVVVQLDNNRNNFDLDNLVCISRAVLSQINKKRFREFPPELKHTVITMEKLNEAIRKNL